MDNNNFISTHPKWNNKEFCAFLFLYSAMADEVITEEERDALLDDKNLELQKKIKKFIVSEFLLILNS